MVAVVGLAIGMVGGRAVWAAQVMTFDMSGLVWCKPGRLAGISGCAGLLWVGWRAARLSRGCQQRARNVVVPGEMRCDDLSTSADVATLGQRVEGAYGDRLWWGSWPGRCWGNDREKP